MDSRIEKLLNRQIELIERLQDRSDEILDWRTSPENAEAVLGYFEALECAVESLEGLSEFYQESKDWNLEEKKERKSDRDKDDEDRNDYRISSRDREDRDEYQDRRRL
ncbi:hypothetical protein WA1_03745 [Scytonema hofmannii PCC 7110]|jgi:hypothetical protein|uniref:Uncharacterized protein n=1 Tax=Scytonema hofmannii PCC 7110 TaxID=128403 RepID=A0A139X936_9CYAN|nr:hypothetical protein [Scytonema hofmannii]KYC41209.1 hypothetical protein WA1_03745 [Scytonema hofmannii PCC 7110]